MRIVLDSNVPSRLIVSGDKHLLDISPYQEIEVVKPRQFVDKFLSKSQSS